MPSDSFAREILPDAADVVIPPDLAVNTPDLVSSPVKPAINCPKDYHTPQTIVNV